MNKKTIPSPHPEIIKKFVGQAKQEDLGTGDHTTMATIPIMAKGQMQLLVKESGIIGGIQAAKMIFKEWDPKIRFKAFTVDGEKAKKGTVAFIVTGPVHSLLSSERTILNVMQRMSGIATQTHKLIQLCRPYRTKVTDTRKTTPLFRTFEKWAVLIGGGVNHRMGLYDMILIKDNHIDFCGGITEAVSAAGAYRRKNKLGIKIEVECRTLKDVEKVVAQGIADRILFDNFTVPQTLLAVSKVNGKMITESSGGITEKNIAFYSKTGVDLISIGALTHHVRSLDLSLKAKFEKK